MHLIPPCRYQALSTWLCFFSHLLVFNFLFSFSVNATDLWTRYEFVNLSLPTSDHVNALFEDEIGQIWVGADSGLYRIHNNKLQKVTHAPNVEISDIAQFKSQEVWLTSDQGIWLWQSQTNAFIPISCPAESAFRRVIAHPKMGLLALARSGVYQIDKNKPCQQLAITNVPTNANIEQVELFDHKLIIGVRGHGLFQCDDTCSNVKAFASELQNTRVRELRVTDNALFAGTHKHGFYQINKQGNVQKHWHRNAEKSPIDLSLPVNGVMSIYKTKRHVWAGLWAGGLQQFDADSGQKLSSSRHYAPDLTTLGGRHVRAILASQNETLYVGHENGVSVLLPELNQYGWIGLENEFQAGFTQNNITSLTYTDDYVLAGSTSGGLYLISTKENMFERFAPDAEPPFNLPTKSIWQMTLSQQGDLLLGTSNGAFRFDTQRKKWRSFGDPSKLKSADVYRLSEGFDNTIWLSLWEGGIVQLDSQGTIINQWLSEDGLQQNTSTELKHTRTNDVFALNNAGLFRLNTQTNHFEDASLLSNQKQCESVEHINTDRVGQLWALCGHTYLYFWSSGSWKNAPIPIEDPVQHIFPALNDNEPNKKENLFILTAKHLVALDQEGHILWQKERPPLPTSVTMTEAMIVNNMFLLATNVGLYKYNLDNPLRLQPQVSAMISGIRLFNKPLKLPSLSEKLPPSNALYQGQLQLTYDQDLITFEFGIPGFQTTPAESFQYRLLPFDRQWIPTAEDEAKASYTRLPPGRYTFEVQAQLPKETVSATFKLEILPPWYLTWWAKAIALILVLCSIVAIILSRTWRLKQRNLWLQERVKARTAELEHANLKLQQAANLDALTGLLNRRGFRNLSDPHWQAWQGKVILMIADIDHFKQINDKFGHHIGDEVLVQCAKRLQQCAAPSDHIARWGGEEFLILLRDESETDMKRLTQRAKEFQQIIGATPMTLSSETLTVTLTAGLCEHQGQRFEDCLQQADQKLYDGKNGGRNQLVQ